MKRILSLILAASLLLICAVPVFAEDIRFEGTGDEEGVEASKDVNISHTVGNAFGTSGESHDADVSYTVAGGYLICIPGEVAFVKNENTATYERTLPVGVVDVRVPGTLHISITSKNYKDSNWVLTSARGDSLRYSIKVDGQNVENGGDILSAAHGTDYLENEVSFKLEETDAKMASYTDTLTFTVSVK